MAKYYKTKVLNSVEEVCDVVIPLRRQGRTVVTTNGCFDLLHAGHLQYLSDAAVKGDILVVGINSDAVVRKLKGANRPIQSEDDRASVIGSLKMVDYVFIFREDDPRAFLDILKPDIHVKGGDYTEDIIEKPIVEANGGKVVIVPFKQGFSTSQIINKIKLTSLKH